MSVSNISYIFRAYLACAYAPRAIAGAISVAYDFVAELLAS
jgi:hypothetical protein